MTGAFGSRTREANVGRSVCEFEARLPHIKDPNPQDDVVRTCFKNRERAFSLCLCVCVRAHVRGQSRCWFSSAMLVPGMTFTPLDLVASVFINEPSGRPEKSSLVLNFVL